MTPEKIKQIRSASYLLPEPGDAVVRECLDEIERLRAENEKLKQDLDGMIAAAESLQQDVYSLSKQLGE